MTTVAFVTYLFQSNPRRVGPMPEEAAQAFAKEIARRKDVTAVRLEEWMCVKTKEVT